VSAPADIGTLRYVVERDPASPLFFELAERLAEGMADGGLSEAVGVLRAGLKVHPHHLPARVLLGVCLARLGEAEAAQEELERAAEAAGEVAGRLYPELAGLYEQKGLAEPGLAALRVAEALAPLGPELLELKGRLGRLLKEERARRALDGAEALLEEGQAEAAAAVLDEALKEQPGHLALEERLRRAKSEVARQREAGQVIAVLQGWLHNIRETT
jgi:tetratricopeptide (TPR) repeat protein